MQKFDVIRVHDITQLRALIGSSGHFMPKRSWILPSDETIQIPLFLDELITSPDKFLKTGVNGWGMEALHIMAYAGRPLKKVPFSGFRNMNGADSTS